MIGQRFSRWVIIGDAERYVAPNGRKNRRWLCRCDCGTERVVTQMKLRDGDSQSCGCLKSANLSVIKRKHGHYVNKTPSPTYVSWRAMIGRCTQRSHGQYGDYGGRGIKVCERWRTFENFLADMGERPDGRSIDRIDNDGNYESGNCRWATRLEQRHNRRAA